MQSMEMPVSSVVMNAMMAQLPLIDLWSLFPPDGLAVLEERVLDL